MRHSRAFILELFRQGVEGGLVAPTLARATGRERMKIARAYHNAWLAVDQECEVKREIRETKRPLIPFTKKDANTKSEVPHNYRSMEHAARIAVSMRVIARLKNPNVRFKYQTATAQFLRQFLPCDDPTLDQLQDAYNEIGKRTGLPPEDLLGRWYERIKSEVRGWAGWQQPHSDYTLKQWSQAKLWLESAQHQLPLSHDARTSERHAIEHRASEQVAA